MPERKRRNDPLDANLVNLDANLDEGVVEIGSGYSISLDYTKEVPTVYVRTYGEVDSISLKRSIAEHYPGAKIEGLFSKWPVRIVLRKMTKSKKKPKK